MLRFFIFFSTTPLVFASTLGDCFLEHANQELKLKTIKNIYKNEKKVNGDKRDILGTPLYLAAKSGSLPLVTFLIKKGANVNKANSSSDTPLHVASAYGHLEIVKYLIKHKAKANKKNSIGKRPIELARLRNKPLVVKYFKKIKNKKAISTTHKEKRVNTKTTKKNFHHLPYAETIEKYDDLPFVQTIEVVSKSKPYVESNS